MSRRRLPSRCSRIGFGLRLAESSCMALSSLGRPVERSSRRRSRIQNTWTFAATLRACRRSPSRFVLPRNSSRRRAEGRDPVTREPRQTRPATKPGKPFTRMPRMNADCSVDGTIRNRDDQTMLTNGRSGRFELAFRAAVNNQSGRCGFATRQMSEQSAFIRSIRVRVVVVPVLSFYLGVGRPGVARTRAISSSTRRGSTGFVR